MPTPIPITRKPSDYDSFGSLKPASLTLPSSGSFKEPTSFGKETTNDLMEFTMSRFSTSVESEATVAPSSFSRLETTFCRNFTCCGQSLADLHDLLQHYEECHVKFEDDDMASVTEDDMTASSSSSSSDSSSSSQPPSPKPSNGELKRKAGASVDAYGDNTSAFDTAVMRSPNPTNSTTTTTNTTTSSSSSNSKGKKRSFGQYSSSNPNTNPAVHQSLRRALMDGGIGRGSSGSGRQPSIYSANSPFSTPGSSIPGTPVVEDVEMFGSGPNGASAFSSLNIRSNSEDHHLPSCAPPNLFFPTATTTTSAPSSKSQKTSKDSSSSSHRASTSKSSSPSPSSPSINSAASMINLPGSTAEQPSKCQAPGCDKAYKQANGLKYHRLHGSCNQNNVPLSTKSGVLLQRAVSSSQGSSSSSDRDSMSPSPTLSSRGIFATTSLTTSPMASPTASRHPSLSPEAMEISDPMNNTPVSSAPPSPALTKGELPNANQNNVNSEKVYICQVGECGKRYKNLNGLRYHYAHSGSHGALGLALLQANGGGASAKVNEATGRPAVSTATLSSAALAAAAKTAAASQASQAEAKYNVGGITSTIPSSKKKEKA